MDVNTGRGISMMVSVLLIFLTAIQAADPKMLGLSPVASAWIGVFGTALGAVAVFLPSPRKWWAE